MVWTWCASEPVAPGVCIRTFSCNNHPRQQTVTYPARLQWLAHQVGRIRHRGPHHSAHQPPSQLDRHPSPIPIARPDRTHPRQHRRLARVVPTHPNPRVRSLSDERGGEAFVDGAGAFGGEERAEGRPPRFWGGAGCGSEVGELLADFDSATNRKGRTGASGQHS